MSNRNIACNVGIASYHMPLNLMKIYPKVSYKVLLVFFQNSSGNLTLDYVFRCSSCSALHRSLITDENEELSGIVTCQIRSGNFHLPVICKKNITSSCSHMPKMLD